MISMFGFSAALDEVGYEAQETKNNPEKTMLTILFIKLILISNKFQNHY